MDIAVELSLYPLNAQYIRNLILINHGLHDHIVHFYHLSALDFVDIMKIPAADPKKTAALAESLTKGLQRKIQQILGYAPVAPLHLPQIPYAIDHAVVRIENGIISRGRDVNHVSANPDVYIVVVALQTIGE